MTALQSTLALPLRNRPEAPGSIYIPMPRLAQPGAQSQQSRTRTMSRNIQRLYGVFTMIAVAGLLSPLVMASATFATVPR